MALELIAAFAVAVFMGLNIGGNNAAAAMGAAYGAKARTKYQAVLLIGVFSFLGAVLSGEEVIKTLGKGILPEGTILLEGAIVAVGAAAATVFLANMLRVPISTSQGAVGAVVWIGFFYGASKVNLPLLAYIVSWWVVTPILAWLLAYILGKYFYADILVWLADHSSSEASIKRMLNVLLTISGCYVAFSAGANNAANASPGSAARMNASPTRKALTAFRRISATSSDARMPLSVTTMRPSGMRSSRPRVVSRETSKVRRLRLLMPTSGVSSCSAASSSSPLCTSTSTAMP